MQPVSQIYRLFNIPDMPHLWRGEQTGNLHTNIRQMMQDTMQTGGLKWIRGAIEGQGITTPRRFHLSPQPQINRFKVKEVGVFPFHFLHLKNVPVSSRDINREEGTLVMVDARQSTQLLNVCNRRGPSTEPCGMPQVTESISN